jgi:putative metalloprotease
MAMAFETLQALSSGGTASGTQGASGSSVSSLFSTHPATQTRIDNMAARATADGFQRPARK